MREISSPLSPGPEKAVKRLNLLMDAAYRDKSLSISQTNCIIKAIKEGKMTTDLRHSNLKKTRWTNNIVASIAATVGELADNSL